LRLCFALFAAGSIAAMKSTSTITAADLSPLERRKKIRVSDAAALNDLSEASFRRHYAHLIRKITPRRDAVELGDAIALPPKPSETADSYDGGLPSQRGRSK
jgi:hypothetical protein